MLGDGRLRFNGAVFWQEWEDLQFSFLGINGLTVIKNVGSATMKGIETDIAWAMSDQFTLTGSATYLNSEFSGVAALDGSEDELPVTPNLKLNMTGRYEFNFHGWDAYAQGSLVYSDDVGLDLRSIEAAIIGRLPSYTLVDLSTGVDTGSFTVDFYLTNAFDERALLARSTECQIATGPTQVPPRVALCGNQPYDLPTQPRTFGVRVGQRF
jgi:outer membrane receptor protein involved in Fe transport